MPLPQVTRDNREPYEFLSRRDLPCQNSTVQASEQPGQSRRSPASSTGGGGPARRGLLRGPARNDSGTARAQPQARWLLTASLKEIIKACLRQAEK